MQSLLIGLDIGGVNIKCSSIPRAFDKKLEDAYSTKKYFPLWQNSRDKLPAIIAEILSEHVSYWQTWENEEQTTRIHICASITGELSDAYTTKKEGIIHITGSLHEACKKMQARKMSLEIMDPIFISTDGMLYNIDDAVTNYRSVAAANWHATAIWVGSFVKDCILVDCGSTTTDIIPIIEGMPVSEGLTDFARLASGELVYTGVLRATIPSITHEVPVNGAMIPVSFEKFALMADVHMILGNITFEQYDCDTADGRSTSIDNCIKRLARSVCEDAEDLGYTNIIEMARFLHQKQVDMVWDGLQKVLMHLLLNSGISAADLDCVITGLGEDALAKLASTRAGFRSIIPLSSKIGMNATIISSAIGVIHVLAEHLNQGAD
ncbi:MAG TPA: hydantoinase/oxoprolinase family protein [Candidatus Lokiarchaeia archaeon]|nr:hydantoinase/oxoprolinase family protein [Candidatus Lokiarchaeia archaeon]